MDHRRPAGSLNGRIIARPTGIREPEVVITLTNRERFAG
jgi:hypothetical protein